MTMDELNVEALQRIEAAIGAKPRPALLRQVIAVCAGQLATAEGGAHVLRVFANIGSAFGDRAA